MPGLLEFFRLAGTASPFEFQQFPTSRWLSQSWIYGLESPAGALAPDVALPMPCQDCAQPDIRGALSGWPRHASRVRNAFESADSRGLP